MSDARPTTHDVLGYSRLKSSAMLEFSYDHGKFLHRIAQDGTMELVCLTCFVTVSRIYGNFALTADELNQIEGTHVCELTR